MFRHNAAKCCALISKGMSKGNDIIDIRANPPAPLAAMEKDRVSREAIPHIVKSMVRRKMGRFESGQPTKNIYPPKAIKLTNSIKRPL